MRRKLVDTELKNCRGDLEKLAKERTRELEVCNEQIKDSEKKYRDLVDNALVGVYESTFNGELIYVNEAGFKMLEYDSPEDFISNGALSKYRNVKDREFLVDILRKKGSVRGVEIDFLAKSGGNKDPACKRLMHGEKLFGTVTDITERKKTEENLRQHQQTTQQILDTIPNLLYIFDLVYRTRKKRLTKNLN